MSKKFGDTEWWWLSHWNTGNMVDRLDHPPVHPEEKRVFNALQRLAQKGIVTITQIDQQGRAHYRINKAEFLSAINYDPSNSKPGKKAGTYYTYAEAKAKVQALNIKTVGEYRERFQSDPMLPSDPARTYGDEFEGWPAFCGKTKFSGLSADKYTYDEASAAAQRLGIQSKAEYEQRHHEDPRLPAVPSRFYGEQWPSEKPWFKFLGKVIQYRTLDQAAEAAQLLGCKTKRDYDQKHAKDPRLPRCPDAVYEDWAGWDDFLGKQ